MRSSDEGLDVDMTAPPSVPDSPPDASRAPMTGRSPPAVPDSPSEDESMEPPQAPAAASLPRVDPRPTMADVLSQQELLRRDHAETEAARRRVETPKPLACDIEAIERQYDMVIDTGRTFAKTPLQKIMASLSGKSHGTMSSSVCTTLYEIGQVSKLPGGNLRVKSSRRKRALSSSAPQVNILGGRLSVKKFDVLSAKYFIDISNVDSDTNTDLILERLFLLGCKPVYDTFREVNLATGLTSATWRVYFLSNSFPGALMINGSVCDQVLFDNKLHPAHGKNAPYQSERLPFGYRSHHGLDLSTSESEFPPPEPATEPAPAHAPQQQQQRPTMYAHAAGTTTMPKQTSLQKAVKEVKNREAQLQRGAQHGQHLAANQLAKLPAKSDDALSISTFNGSNSKITPPSSPKAPKKPILLTNGPDDGFKTVSNKKKRTRNEVDFSNLMVKQQSQPLDGVATANYFQALQSMEVTFESKNRPDAVKASTESAFFVEKHHTKIKKASKASSVMEVTEAMLDDENTALLNVIPDRSRGSGQE
ncbi:hypothetical protein Pcac1_g29042, partial [Phytophthora cactorum]